MCRCKARARKFYREAAIKGIIARGDFRPMDRTGAGEIAAGCE
jgi:hypothetical protein